MKWSCITISFFGRFEIELEQAPLLGGNLVL
jgi:hypothetical protein